MNSRRSTVRRRDRFCTRCLKLVPRLLWEAHKLAEDAIDEYEAAEAKSESHPVYAPWPATYPDGQLDLEEMLARRARVEAYKKGKP